MAIARIGESEVFDAGSNPPRRVVMPDKNGVPVVHKLTHLPTVKYVNPVGHVLSVALSNGAANRTTRNQYAVEKMERLKQNGWIRYGECPIRSAAGWLPEEFKKQAPCEPGTHGEGKACKHVEKIIELRRKPHEEQEARKERLTKSADQRREEMLETFLVGDAKRK